MGGCEQMAHHGLDDAGGLLQFEGLLEAAVVTEGDLQLDWCLSWGGSFAVVAAGWRWSAVAVVALKWDEHGVGSGVGD